MADTEFIAVARSFGTCVLSDALDVLGRDGVVTGLRHLSGSPSLAGRAVTVQLGVAPAAGGAAPKRHLCTAAVAAAGAGDVIVVSHPGVGAAGWGGMLSLGARLNGVDGVVIDGPARDVDEAHELGFTVVAAAPTPRTARGRVVEIDWNCPIELAGVAVSPGDIVVVDENGVVIIPASDVDDVLAEARRIADREAEIAKALRAGVAVAEAMGASYEQLLSRPDVSAVDQRM